MNNLAKSSIFYFPQSSFIDCYVHTYTITKKKGLNLTSHHLSTDEKLEFLPVTDFFRTALCEAQHTFLYIMNCFVCKHYF